MLFFVRITASYKKLIQSMKDFVSIIFTTYNQPLWLEKVLWGYECQTHKNFEVIIADDGSGSETKAVIDSFLKRKTLNIKHIWHPDEGYQKCPILNKAVLAANSDYLIFSDGDCIPREDFVAVHVKYRKTGYFLSGGTLRLPLNTSNAITQQDIVSQQAFKLKWLYTNGLPHTFKSSKLITSKWYTILMNILTPTKASWNGHNSSGWKKDIIAINGFNEGMHYGGQDRELGERLQNFGIKSKQIRYSAICIHLEHGRPYKTKASIERNRAIRDQVKKTRHFWIDNGIKKPTP
jgi:glycosyltransferase involved in cell wall biosynthesis